MTRRDTYQWIRAAILTVVAVWTVFGVPFGSTLADAQEGWLKAGSSPADYDHGLEPGGGRDGGACAYLRSDRAGSQVFGTMMQNVAAEKYHGQRLRLRGWMRSEDVEGWAGFWVRVDDKARSANPLAFDNMNDRAVTGTTDWSEYSVVLDVPEKAGNVAFGYLISGQGSIWVDDIQLEIVEDSVEVTDLSSNWAPRAEPQNLDFEQR